MTEEEYLEGHIKFLEEMLGSTNTNTQDYHRRQGMLLDNIKAERERLNELRLKNARMPRRS